MTNETPNNPKKINPFNLTFEQLDAMKRPEINQIGKSLGLRNMHACGRDRGIDKIVKTIEFMKAQNSNEVNQDPLQSMSGMGGLNITIAETDPETGEKTGEESVQEIVVDKGTQKVTLKPVSKDEFAIWKRKSGMALKRVQLRCFDKNNNDLPGKIFSISNPNLGTLSMWIPYNPSFYANGWYIPQAMLDHLDEQVYHDTQVVEELGPNGGKQEMPGGQDVKAFQITYMKLLTAEELEQLAGRQNAARMAGLMD